MRMYSMCLCVCVSWPQFIFQRVEKWVVPSLFFTSYPHTHSVVRAYYNSDVVNAFGMGGIYGNVMDLNTICKYPIRERVRLCCVPTLYTYMYIAFDNNFCFIKRRHLKRPELICTILVFGGMYTMSAPLVPLYSFII